VGCNPQNPPLRIAKTTLKLRHQIVYSHFINKTKRQQNSWVWLFMGWPIIKWTQESPKSKTLDTIASPKEKQLDKTQHDRPQWKGSTS
jgi:hypothetical protein